MPLALGPPLFTDHWPLATRAYRCLPIRFPTAVPMALGHAAPATPSHQSIIAFTCQLTGSCGYWAASSAVTARLARIVK
jgi:hypothetical protein